MTEPAGSPKRHPPSSIAAAIFIGLVLAIPVVCVGLILLFSGRAVVVLIAAPALAALVATALTRLRWRWNGPWMAAIGLLVPCGVMVDAWLTSPLSSAPYNGCSDCGNYLGHWWEPWFALFFGIFGYGVWLAGVGLGIAVVAALEAARRRHQTAPQASH